MDRHNKKEKILLVHASFGEGHKRAAMALQKSFHAPCQDLLDFSPWFVRKIFSKGYITVSQRLPTFWKMLFHGTKYGRVQKSVENINRFLASQFLAYLRRTKPTVVVSTHFFPLYFISSAKQEFPIKVVAIVTDLKAHPLWLNPCVDLYFVATKETKASLIFYGVPAEKIIYGYVPLREGFLMPLSSRDLRKRFDLDEKPCLLFMSSSGGKLPYLARTIRTLLRDYNIFVIYGKNMLLKQYLRRLHHPRLKIFSFYENIWELIHLSSVIITKPGGLTIFEGLYKRKSFIFTHFIPGQEQENMELLVKYGVARYVTTKRDFIYAIKELCDKEKRFHAAYPVEVHDIRIALKRIVPHLRASVLSR